MVNKISASLTLFACTISGGILNLPAIFKSMTLLEDFILTTIAAVTTMFSLMILVTFHGVDPTIKSYGELLIWLGGVKFAKLVELVLGLFLVGVTGGSFIVIHNFFIDKTPTDLHAGLATACGAILILGLAWPSDIGRLATASSFSVLAFVFLVFTLIYYGVDSLDNGHHVDEWSWTNDDGSETAADDDTVTETNPDGSFFLVKMAKHLPPIIYAFGCQIQIYEIFLDVEKERASMFSQGGIHGLWHFMPVIFAACTSMIACFSCVGFFGVLSFPNEEIDSDVLIMLEQKGTLGAVARATLVVAITLSAPLITLPARNCILSAAIYLFTGEADSGSSSDDDFTLTKEELCSEFERKNKKWRNASTTFCVSCSCVLAISGVKFGTLLNVLGAFVAAPLMIILPAVALLKKLTMSEKQFEEEEDEKIQKHYEKLLGESSNGRTISTSKHSLTESVRLGMIFISAVCVFVGFITFGVNLVELLS